MNGEPPVFGENGAVLNSETMTDDWRAEHDKTVAERMEEETDRIRDTSIIMTPAFLVLIALPHILPKDLPQHRMSLIALAAFTMTAFIMERLLRWRLRRNRKYER